MGASTDPAAGAPAEAAPNPTADRTTDRTTDRTASTITETAYGAGSPLAIRSMASART